MNLEVTLTNRMASEFGVDPEDMHGEVVFILDAIRVALSTDPALATELGAEQVGNAVMVKPMSENFFPYYLSTTRCASDDAEPVYRFGGSTTPHRSDET